MTRITLLVAPLCAISVFFLWGCSGLGEDETVSEQQLACEALAQTPNLTITVAQWVEATDPDLSRFLLKKNGKLIIYHGWADSAANPEPTLDYYQDVVATTFNDDIDAAKQKVQLFMAPGMEHWRNGPGPNSWDKLAPLVEWVENAESPDFIVATHSTDGVVDNERPICAYPGKAVYRGPAGGENDPANWVASNFACQ